MKINKTIMQITRRIRARSERTRARYLERMQSQLERGVQRSVLSCGNLAHGFAACQPADKASLATDHAPNLGIVTAYNDMLSAHQPYRDFPELIKKVAREQRATAQVAGGVPAMCDGVTQGQDGMDLSLFSRDVIAMATAIALSHNMFDAGVYLGICDKIVPGMLIGALSFGHLPAMFIPAGPMASGLPNEEKARVRQLFLEGRVGRTELLEAEARSYHSPGTCTFYGTANSNQMLMEIMGLQLPGSSFVAPGSPMRQAFTRWATRQVLSIAAPGKNHIPLFRVLDEKALVNALVGLLATGGSTNHTLHLIAIAAAAGIQLTWDDMSELSSTVPLLTRIYPNGLADINHFHDAGGMGFLISQLLENGYLHEDVTTVLGQGMAPFAQLALSENTARDQDETKTGETEISYTRAPEISADPTILATVAQPFSPDGGLKVLHGNIGKSVIKVSAVKPRHRVVEAPARVFHSQAGMMQAFRKGELEMDVVAVIRFCGPRAIGMPELHKLTPLLGILQDRGFQVALITDGRMSGASGKVPAAIHVTPEAVSGGAIARIRDGDPLRLDAEKGTLNYLGDEREFASRTPAIRDLRDAHEGLGRELFSRFRHFAGPADAGASLFDPGENF